MLSVFAFLVFLLKLSAVVVNIANALCAVHRDRFRFHFDWSLYRDRQVESFWHYKGCDQYLPPETFPPNTPFLGSSNFSNKTFRENGFDRFFFSTRRFDK